MIRFLKAPPTTYVMQFKNGKVKREGAGLSFFYWAPTTTLVMVPLASSDVPFAFQEVTSDFQALTVQGQLTYRVADPKKLASLLDYESDAAGRHLTEDPAKVEERLVHAAQVLARIAVQSMPLKQALARSDALSGQVLAQLRTAERASTCAACTRRSSTFCGSSDRCLPEASASKSSSEASFFGSATR